MNKARLKQLIYGFELRATAIINNGLVNKVSKQTVLGHLKSELNKLSRTVKLGTAEINRLWLNCYSRYIKLSKRTYSKLRKTNNVKERQNIVYGSIKKFMLNEVEHEKNEIANEVEHQGKQKDLRELMSKGVFYLCSSHKNPARDHANYEGKIYVSQDWRNRCNKKDVDSIRAYIRNHKVKTIEWVIGEPVYMVLRPNCKHYFIRVKVEDVLGSSVKSLLRRHKMYMSDQNIMSYEKTVYKRYYEQLKALYYLRDMSPSEEIDKDIKNTRRLLRIWKERLEQASTN